MPPPRLIQRHQNLSLRCYAVFMIRAADAYAATTLIFAYAADGLPHAAATYVSPIESTQRPRA